MNNYFGKIEELKKEVVLLNQLLLKKTDDLERKIEYSSSQLKNNLEVQISNIKTQQIVGERVFNSKINALRATLDSSNNVLRAALDSSNEERRVLENDMLNHKIDIEYLVGDFKHLKNVAADEKGVLRKESVTYTGIHSKEYLYTLKNVDVYWIRFGSHVQAQVRYRASSGVDHGLMIPFEVLGLPQPNPLFSTHKPDPIGWALGDKIQYYTENAASETEIFFRDDVKKAFLRNRHASMERGVDVFMRFSYEV